MKLIPLSGGKAFAKVDDDDYEFLSQFNWTAYRAGQRTYAQCQLKFNGRWTAFYMHRLIAAARAGEIVDHSNGDGIDNQRSNLRLCTTQQNQWNHRKGRGKHQFKGVSFDGSRRTPWASMIRSDGRVYHLGRYSTEHHAALMYDFWVHFFNGEFAAPNFKLVSEWTAQ